MINRLLCVGVLSVPVLAVAACAPAEPPAVEEEAPPAPPPPPPAIYDIDDVDIVTQEPAFTSRNVRFAGIQIGDVTNDVLDILGEQSGETQNSVDHYVSAYRNGGLIVHTFKNTGEIRKFEVLTRLASEVVSPQLEAWLENGDLDGMREIMGPEEDVDEVPQTGATEYVYDERGVRFVVYEDQNGIRFSYYR